MTFKHYLGIGLGAVFIILLVKSFAQGTTDVQVVKVPEVKTHVVTKTVTEYAPMPSECLRAIDEVKAASAPSDKQAEAAGQLLLDAQTLGREQVSHNIKAINQVTASIRKWEDQLNTAIIESSQAKQSVDLYLQLCMTRLDDR